MTRFGTRRHRPDRAGSGRVGGGPPLTRHQGPVAVPILEHTVELASHLREGEGASAQMRSLGRVIDAEGSRLIDGVVATPGIWPTQIVTRALEVASVIGEPARRYHSLVDPAWLDRFHRGWPRLAEGTWRGYQHAADIAERFVIAIPARSSPG